MSAQTYSILRDDRGRSGSIRYSVERKSLSLYYEADESGFVACAEDPLYWTSPVREIMDTNERKHILERIERWIEFEKLPIQITK